MDTLSAFQFGLFGGAPPRAATIAPTTAGRPECRRRRLPIANLGCRNFEGCETNEAYKSTARAYVKKAVFFAQYWFFVLTEEPDKKKSSRTRAFNTFLIYHIS